LSGDILNLDDSASTAELVVAVMGIAQRLRDGGSIEAADELDAAVDAWVRGTDKDGGALRVLIDKLRNNAK
jgi:hypothetical protein